MGPRASAQRFAINEKSAPTPSRGAFYAQRLGHAGQGWLLGIAASQGSCTEKGVSVYFVFA